MVFISSAVNNLPVNLRSVEQTLCAAAEDCGKVGYDMQKSGFERFHKVGMFEAQELVTSADPAAQDAGIKRMQINYPRWPVIAEESGLAKIQTGSYFTLDPIDGTYRFAAGMPDWGVLAGFVLDQNPAAACVYQPVTKKQIVASTGNGTFFNGERVRLRQDLPLSVVISVGPWTDSGTHRQLDTLINRGVPVLKVDSAIEGFMRFFQGEASVCWGPFDKIWEAVPGAIVTTEAGGFVSNLEANPMRWNSLRCSNFLGCSCAHIEQIIGIIRH